MQRSINDPLRSAGRRTRNDDIVVTADMALMVETIVRLSATDTGVKIVISEEEIPLLLDRAKTAFFNFVIEHPDGRRRRATQQGVAAAGASRRR